MSDDIVTRLRNIASLRGNLSGSVIPAACTEAADEIERLRADHYSAFVLKEGELLVVTVPDWMTHLDLNEMVEGLPEDLRKRTVLLRGVEEVRGE